MALCPVWVNKTVKKAVMTFTPPRPGVNNAGAGGVWEKTGTKSVMLLQSAEESSSRSSK